MSGAGGERPRVAEDVIRGGWLNAHKLDALVGGNAAEAIMPSGIYPAAAPVGAACYTSQALGLG